MFQNSQQGDADPSAGESNTTRVWSVDSDPWPHSHILPGQDQPSVAVTLAHTLVVTLCPSPSWPRATSLTARGASRRERADPHISAARNPLLASPQENATASNKKIAGFATHSLMRARESTEPFSFDRGGEPRLF